MTSSTETGGVTGTPDKDYNLIWYVEACLSNALRLETYIQDAEREKDTEVADLGLCWKPGFAALGPAFFTELRPTPLPDPYWVGRSEAVARELGLPAGWHSSDGTLAALTGNLPVAGSRPFATVSASSGL